MPTSLNSKLVSPKSPAPTWRSAPLGPIQFVHDKKTITFDPIEYALYPDNIQQAFSESLMQATTVGYWLALMQRRQEDATRELKAYEAKLYHLLKTEGKYADKYHGARPTEDALQHAINADKTFLEQSMVLDRLKEIVNQLWNLNRILERKHDVLKSVAFLMNSEKRLELLEEQYRKEARR